MRASRVGPALPRRRPNGGSDAPAVLPGCGLASFSWFSALATAGVFPYWYCGFQQIGI
jgi:hypothetical protein